MSKFLAITIAVFCCLFRVFGSDSEPCPAGYSCLESNARSLNQNSGRRISPCPIGTYSELGQIDCTPCVTGYYTVRIASASCTACPLGHMCSKPNRNPVKCPLSTYSSCLAQNCCTPCPYGMHTLRVGSTQCVKCPAGKACTPSPISACGQ